MSSLLGLELISGQERFTWMTRVYYKDSHGCVIMFDLTNKNSFVNTLKWKRDVDSKCSLPDGSPIPCMLLANKCDLAHRQIDQMQIETFYKEHNFIGWTETSAKEGLMVNDSMKYLKRIFTGTTVTNVIPLRPVTQGIDNLSTMLQFGFSIADLIWRLCPETIINEPQLIDTGALKPLPTNAGNVQSSHVFWPTVRYACACSSLHNVRAGPWALWHQGETKSGVAGASPRHSWFAIIIPSIVGDDCCLEAEYLEHSLGAGEVGPSICNDQNYGGSQKFSLRNYQGFLRLYPKLPSRDFVKVS
uniref:Uncharacterized protein n=1 Tax=Timema bartmani TaxID=61472 RepID=A0A7R9F1S2_9NEOP|nr:unnamed protein product [Timema bartmani]